MSAGDFLGDRRSALEESFFAAKDRELLDNLRNELAQKERKEALAEVCGVSDSALLDSLVELDLSAETVAALSLIPLIQVAWSDDKIEDRERQAILDAANSQGIKTGSAEGELLHSWLDSKPEPSLLQAWKDYVRELCRSLDASAKIAVNAALLDRARAVAEAAGGILGLGNKVSASEQAVLDDLVSFLE